MGQLDTPIIPTSELHSEYLHPREAAAEQGLYTARRRNVSLNIRVAAVVS